MAILNNSNAISSGGFTISNSLRFRRSASARLSRTVTSGQSQSNWIFSVWVKRGVLGSTMRLLSVDSSNLIGFNSSDNIEVVVNATTIITTTQVYRDPAAWYHIVVRRNSNNYTLHVNGVQIATGSQNNGTIGGQSGSNIVHYIGSTAGASFFDGYMAELNWSGSSTATYSNFGATDTATGVWIPAEFTGSYGTVGSHLTFSDNSALTTSSNVGLGKDFSGNGNYWATTNISITSGETYDSMIDVPTLTSATTANYCVLNNVSTLTTATTSNANLAFTTTTVGHNAIGSIGMSSGKYYWEAQTSAGTTEARATVYGTSASSYYSFAANNTVYGFRFDADLGTLDYTTNGSSWTSLATGLTSGPYFPYFNNNGTTSKTISVNFGQRPFTYTTPTGYVALNTYNLPTPTIGTTATTQAYDYMDATLYTGTGSSRSVTNAGGFQPDFVWVKSRSAVSDHALYDSVRGTTQDLASNSTAAETTQATGLTAFNSNGFTVGALSKVNNNTATFVAWQWRAGQGTTSSNTDGSITSTVSVNATAGFSIVTYTGTGANATVGHGLGVAPKMIIVKGRTNVDNWQVYHSNLTSASYRILLNSSAAESSQPAVWNSTAPTSSVFSLGTGTSVNQSSQTFVAYCFAEINGFSKINFYTGNGNANGPFIYTGFRPKFVIVKSSSSGTDDWAVYDTSRDTYNVSINYLSPTTSGAESTAQGTLDFLSNGFKIRNTNSRLNTNSGTYIYMAFAESPFKYANAR